MIPRILMATLLIGATLSISEGRSPRREHLDFQLVRGSAGYIPATKNTVMFDAPAVVLSFSTAVGHKTLVLTDSVGDYVAVLQPGEYCVAAYDLKTGTGIPLNSKQLRCVRVTKDRDVRLDVMLERPPR